MSKFFFVQPNFSKFKIFINRQFKDYFKIFLTIFGSFNKKFETPFFAKHQQKEEKSIPPAYFIKIHG